MPPEELVNQQRRFWQMITAPTGVAGALPEMARTDPGAVPLDHWIVAPDEEGAVKRLDVYANMYFYRLLDIIKDDYDKLHTLIGEENFHNLITDYLLVHKSTCASVRHVGRSLPAFLSTHELNQVFPGASDLAQLEWARVDAFDATDAEPIDRQALAGLADEQWGALRLRLTPSLQLLQLGHAAPNVWQQIVDGEPPAAADQQPTNVVVWRREFRIFHRSVSDIESRALRAAARGVPFAAVCEQAAPESADVPTVAQAVVVALQRWLDDGLVVGHDIAPGPGQ